MRYLLFEVFQGDENARNTHTFLVGPFDPKMEIKRGSEAFKFRVAFGQGIDAFNHKHGWLTPSPKRLFAEVEVKDLPATNSPSPDIPSPDIPMTEFMQEVGRWFEEDELVAA